MENLSWISGWNVWRREGADAAENAKKEALSSELFEDKFTAMVESSRI